MNDWRAASACRDTDPAVFYPPADPHANARKVRADPYAAARIVCDGCPVQADCLTEAVTNGDPYGFRAGMTPDQIADMIAKRTGGDTAKVCEMCGGSFTVGAFAGIRRYCGATCASEAQAESKRAYQRRVRGTAA